MKKLLFVFWCSLSAVLASDVQPFKPSAPKPSIVVTVNAPGLPIIPDEILHASYRVSIHGPDVFIGRNANDVPQYKPGDVLGSGSGVAYDSRHVITASHVAECNIPGCTRSLDIFDADGKYKTSLRLILDRIGDADGVPEPDLAILHTEEDIPAFHKIEYGQIRVGQWCYHVGASWGGSPYCSYWFTVAGTENASRHELAQGSCTVAPGCSGGAVYDSDNHFIGIVTRGRDAVVLFVPWQAVKTFIEAK